MNSYIENTRNIIWGNIINNYTQGVGDVFTILKFVASVFAFFSILILILTGFKFARAEPKEGIPELKKGFGICFKLLALASAFYGLFLLFNN